MGIPKKDERIRGKLRDGLSDALRELRLKKGVRQNTAAAALGWKQTKLCRIEKGHTVPNIGDAAKLAAYYGTTADELLRPFIVRDE